MGYKYHAFISHSSIDKKKVRAFKKEIESNNIKVWIDEEGIDVADNIQKRIQKALGECRYIIVVLSKNATQSLWVRQELAPFIKEEKLNITPRIIPVLLSPYEGDLRADFQYLEKKLLVDLTSFHNKDQSKNLVRLINKLQTRLNIEYCELIANQPLLSGAIFNDEYYVEPTNLKDVVFQPIEDYYGAPWGAMRSRSKPKTLDQFQKEFLVSDHHSRNKVIVLIGEAGVGKTTTCKWLCKQFAREGCDDSLIALHVPLGELQESFVDLLDRQVKIKTFDALIDEASFKEQKILIFLDGWNEQDPEKLKEVQLRARQLMENNRISIVITTRPVTATGAIWPGHDVLLFEVQRWTLDQLRKYFRKNKSEHLINKVPDQVLNSLRLPLLGFLVIRRLVVQGDELPDLHTVAEVYEYVLGQFLHEFPFTIELYHKKDLNKSIYSDELRAEFLKKNIRLRADCKIEKGRNNWVILEPEWNRLNVKERPLYEIRNDQHSLVVIPIKGRNLKRGAADLVQLPEVYWQALAYKMTEKKVVQTEARILEEILSPQDKSRFQSFLAFLVNSGLLRCSEVDVALDPTSELDMVRKLRINFLHQAFQEYLTAKHLKITGYKHLPPDVSHDAFWREVPIYMIQSLTSPDDRKNFTLSFIERKSPDFLTAARLVKEIEIRNRSVTSGTKAQLEAEKKVIDGLKKNAQQAKLYSYSIEAFRALGEQGKQALQESLADIDKLERVYARAEAHIVKKDIAGANENGWRTLGRSLYILAEINEHSDLWLIQHLHKTLDSIFSTHLLYHVGEALLTLVRVKRPPVVPTEIDNEATLVELDRKRTNISYLAGLKLTEEGRKRGNPVIKGYGYAVIDEILRKAGRAKEAKVTSLEKEEFTKELTRFLDNQIIRTKSQEGYYKEEFWQRAHASEVLAEVVSPEKCVEVLRALFKSEEKANYDGHEDGNYSQVQSSILKAILRSCDLSQGKPLYWDRKKIYTNWKSFLEMIYQSERVNSNTWACRHIELLLLKWFSEPGTQLDWVKDWEKKEEVVGKEIRGRLRNVIWLSS